MIQENLNGYEDGKTIDSPAQFAFYLETEQTAVFVDEQSQFFFLDMPSADMLTLGAVEDSKYLLSADDVPKEIRLKAEIFR